MLNKVKQDEMNMLGIMLVECDICGNRFSSSMTSAWPFCTSGIPHTNMDSHTQLKNRELLLNCLDYPRNRDWIRPVLELKSSQRQVSWEQEDLPKFPPSYTMTLTKEQFARFRDMFHIQGYFIGNVLNKYNWSMMDLIEYSVKAWKDY